MPQYGTRPSEPADFWSGVRRGRPDECWPWQRSRNSAGYGRVRYRQREWRAHRLAYAFEVADPGDFLVCDHCDNPPCCNPEHLFLGDNSDNMADMAAKGRHPRNRTGYLPTGEAWAEVHPLASVGDRNPAAVLTEADVRTIRRLYVGGGESHRSLAERFGVAKGTITFILQRKTWSHL